MEGFVPEPFANGEKKMTRVEIEGTIPRSDGGPGFSVSIDQDETGQPHMVHIIQGSHSMGAPFTSFPYNEPTPGNRLHENALDLVDASDDAPLIDEDDHPGNQPYNIAAE